MCNLILTTNNNVSSNNKLSINNLINKTISKNERLLAFAKTQPANEAVSIKLLRAVLGYSYKSAKNPLCYNYSYKHECTCDGYTRTCPLYENHLTGCKVSYFPDSINPSMTWGDLVQLEESLIADLKGYLL